MDGKIVGISDGVTVGLWVGSCEGNNDMVGFGVSMVGFGVGRRVGRAVGYGDGIPVG